MSEKLRRTVRALGIACVQERVEDERGNARERTVGVEFRQGFHVEGLVGIPGTLCLS
jgi:hypothetical protein